MKTNIKLFLDKSEDSDLKLKNILDNFIIFFNVSHYLYPSEVEKINLESEIIEDIDKYEYRINMECDSADLIQNLKLNEGD